MSWSNLVKKSSKKDAEKVNVVKKPKKVEKQIENDESIIYKTYGLKNEEEEFELLYSNNLTDIVVEFRDYLENSSYKIFPNNKFTNDLYKFIKYYSHTYDNLIDKVDIFNDNLEKELDEEEEEEYYY